MLSIQSVVVLQKKGSGLNLSTALTTTVDTSTEFLRYRTEKDASGNNTSTEWWVVANADKVYRSATDNGFLGNNKYLCYTWK